MSGARGLIASWVALASIVGSVHAQVPEDVFERPPGPYATGTVEYLWIDSTRSESYTKDVADRRHVLVRIWYPATPVHGAVTAPWFFNLEEFNEDPFLTAGKDVKTYSVSDAPLADDGAPYPVLVYNHGGGWTRFSGTFVTEFLASHGYVVVSVGHAGFNKTVLFPDGFRFAMDTLLPPAETGDLERDAIGFWDYLDEHVVPVWADDAAFAMDRMEQLNKSSSELFHGRLDLDRIGMLGWSLGGALSLEMSRRDPRVKAAADLDGQLFGAVVEEGTRRPVMLLHGGVVPEMDDPAQTPILNKLMAIVEDQWTMFFGQVTNNWHDMTIAGADHGNFSDLVLGSSTVREDRIDPRRGHAIINAYTLAFFDRYLKSGDGAVLDGPSDQYPEVTFRKRH